MPALLKEDLALGWQQWSTPRQWLLHVLSSQRMDVLVGLVVSTYLVAVIIETDLDAKDENVPGWIAIYHPMVLILFAVELAARLFVFRLKFFTEFWNWCDFLLVTVDCLATIISAFVGDAPGASAIRIFRLSRLARASKIVKVLPELHVMVAGLIPALHSIFWGSLLLLVTLILWSIAAVHIINPLNKEVADPSCDRCARAFESVFQSTLTFTQQIVCGDSWGQVTIPIIEAYPATAVYFMAVFASVALAVLNLILGVIVNVATEASDNMRKEMEVDKWMDTQKESLEILDDLDKDKSGVLSKEEVINGYDTNEKLQALLSGMGIEKEELPMVWDHLDSDGSGTLTAKEFSAHLCDMNAANTEFMLMHVKTFILRMNSSITKMKEDLLKEFGLLRAEQGCTKSAMESVSFMGDSKSGELGTPSSPDEIKAVANVTPQIRMESNSCAPTMYRDACKAEKKRQGWQQEQATKHIVHADMLSELQGLLQESAKTLQDIRNGSATIWL